MMWEMLFNLGLVIGLAIIILACLFLARSYRNGLNPRQAIATLVTSPEMSRLKVIQQIHLDSRRRLILIRRDNVEHLLLVGGQQDIVVERGIVHAPPSQAHNTPAKPAPKTNRDPLK